MSPSGDVLLKEIDHAEPGVADDGFEDAGHLPCTSKRRSLLESYFDSAARLHVRCYVRLPGDRDAGECCAVSFLPPFGYDHGFSDAGDSHGNRWVKHIPADHHQRAMLISVGYASEEGERIKFGTLRTCRMRLNRVDACECSGWHPTGPLLETVAPRLVAVAPGTRVDVGLPDVLLEDGELRIVAPGQRYAYVVQRGSHVGDEVAGDGRYVVPVIRQRKKISSHGQIVHIMAGLDFAANTVRVISVAKPKELTLELVKMLICPPESDPPRSTHGLELS